MIPDLAFASAALVARRALSPVEIVERTPSRIAASQPCGIATDGLPIGLQLVGPRLGNARLLCAAALVEGARPWADRRPSVSGL